MIAAGRVSSSARASADGSFHATTTVSAAIAAGTPGLAGIACVASPDPAWASRPSECPW